MDFHKFFKSYWGVIIILFTTLILQYPYFNEIPAHTHAWAMADHWALAKGFIRNGFNFFLPETYLLNPQFPHQWQVPTETSITSVNFPIHQYAVALLMKLFQTEDIWVYQGYSLIYSWVGLWFLYRLFLELSGSKIRATFIALFAALSPIYTYYFASPLPGIPSLANVVIGYFFYYQFIQHNKAKHFALCVLFLSLSALARTTFLIPLLAVWGMEFLRVITRNSSLKKVWFPTFLSATFYTLYYTYNQYLRNKYGSIFLNELMSPESLYEFWETLKFVVDRWAFRYFSTTHYVFLLLTIPVGIYSLYHSFSKKSLAQKIMLLLFSIQTIGACLFAVLMFRQFHSHDYYFLDSLFLPLVFLFGWLLSTLPNIRPRFKWLEWGIAVLAIGPLYLSAYSIQHAERMPDMFDRIEPTVIHFKGANRVLDSLGIESNAKILVPCAYAPNLPLTLMNRKGYAIMHCNEENLKKSLKWNFDWVVFQKEFFMNDVYSVYPSILNDIEVKAETRSLVFCSKAEKPTHLTPEQFLGFENQTPLWNWKAPDTTSYAMNANEEYGFSMSVKDFSQEVKKPSFLIFRALPTWRNSGECRLVVSIFKGEEQQYVRSFVLNTENSSENVMQYFDLSHLQLEGITLNVYVWNTGGADLKLTDVNLNLYDCLP